MYVCMYFHIHRNMTLCDLPVVISLVCTSVFPITFFKHSSLLSVLEHIRHGPTSGPLCLFLLSRMLFLPLHILSHLLQVFTQILLFVQIFSDHCILNSSYPPSVLLTVLFPFIRTVPDTQKVLSKYLLIEWMLYNVSQEILEKQELRAIA